MGREEGKGKKRMEIGEIGGGGIFYVFFFFLDTTGIEILSILSSRALLYIYTRIYSWLYNKWVCLYTYIYIFMYSDINTFVQRTTRHHQNPFQWLPRFQCGLPRWCRWSRSCDSLYNRIFLNHHALLINGLQGFPQLRYFLYVLTHIRSFPHTDWLILGSDGFWCFSCVPMLQAFPNPKSFGKTRQAHRQKFPDGAVALKPQNLKGNKIFRNEQGKGYTNLCSFKAWKVSLLLVSS